MGVINATPDSFSGDGLAYNLNAAADLALRFQEEGADVIDVGGESTRRYDNRPSAEPISAEEELRRVLPVIEKLSMVLSAPVSIDTYRAETARRCLEAGANMVNDVWGVSSDPDMLGVVSEYGVPIVLMHNQKGNQYHDLVEDLIATLKGAIERTSAAGIPKENIIIDPGVGFGKVADQSLELERRLIEFKVLGQPILVGPSRKSHIGMVLGGVPAEERLEGTAAAVALCVAGGADMVRVHDVKEMTRVARVADAIVRGWRPDGWEE